ncbi:tyrosine-type recombinase/integrase [Paraburkholderia sp. MM5477-R1]|uniref:tyrosine-type recombinase/integrase n=1 Tax=Paraburkholderia sp. MM5477-R1 TaxID=2991062 RepID=UPI003D198F2F
MPKLTTVAVKALKPAEQVTDSVTSGLIAEGTADGAKWMFRYVSPVHRNKKGNLARRTMGLGTLATVTLAEARELAQAMRKLVEAGRDPIEERDREKAAARDATIPTFGQAAEAKHKQLKSGWKHPDDANARAWISSVKRHLAPLLERRIDDLKPRDFAQALAVAWGEYPKVAADVLQRASQTMDHAVAQWPEHVVSNPVPSARKLMPSRKSGPHQSKHQPALPHADAPAFVRDHLSGVEPTDIVRACAFVLLHTAVRPNEVREATWDEFDLDAGRWLIPGERMKGRIQHDVPLVPEVVALLRAMRETGLHETYVFPNTFGTNAMPDVPLQDFFRETGVASDTDGRTPVPHGCRACFRGWVDAKGYDGRLGERQLAHRPKGQTAAAYQRDSMYLRRARLLEQWTNYLHGRAVDSNVTPLNLNVAA